MTLKAPLALAIALALLPSYSIANAQGRGEQRSKGRSESHSDARPSLPPRAAPERYQPHAAGTHPHGPMVRAHAVRVLSPRVVSYGGHHWTHWAHAEFARPIYYWEWTTVHHVTCVAEDSYGDQYPVTEETFPGFGLVHMTAIEDDALDRCAAESGGDQTCFLATCSHF
jgi:hypothetical protein